MGRVDAVRCDGVACIAMDLLTTDENPPKEWLVLYTGRDGRRPCDELIFCSLACLLLFTAHQGWWPGAAGLLCDRILSEIRNRLADTALANA